MRTSLLGEFEELILLTVAILGDNAYGVSVTDAINHQMRRSRSISAVHATLQRLEKKGYLRSRVGGAAAERGGRSKRFFTVTPAGAKALTNIKQVREELWKLVPSGALKWKSA